jgi:hypothetical protein
MSQGSYAYTNRPSAWRAISAAVVAIVVLVYIAVAIGTEDFLWFLQRTRSTPVEIQVHFDGQTEILTATDPRFEDINDAIRLTVTQVEGYPQRLGLSEQSLADYRQVYWSVEALYEEPLVLHSRFRFGEPDHLLIPLSGRHTEQNITFLAQNEIFYTGPSLASTVELQRTLRSYGLAPSE